MSELIDLSKLPAPLVVEELSYEQILSETIEDFKRRYPQFGSYVENEPVMKQLEAVAYRELLLRQRINESAVAVMPAHARGADLDNIALFMGVTRRVLSEGDMSATPPKPEVMESDESLRRRYFLSFNSLNTAGARDAYAYHALSCPEVSDVKATMTTPGTVAVTVLATEKSEEASPEVLKEVERILNDINVRPLTDTVVVAAAKIVPYEVIAKITTLPGPDAAVVVEEAKRALEAYTAGVAMIGRDVALSGLYAALHRAGVESVQIISPAETLSISAFEASYCSKIELAHQVL